LSAFLYLAAFYNCLFLLRALTTAHSELRAGINIRIKD